MNNQYELELRTPPFASADSRLLRTGNLPAIVATESPVEPTGLWQRAQKAPPSLLPPDINVSDALRLTIVQCRWHVAANATVFIESHEPEAIHQLRVGLRRLRVALTSFGGEFRTPQFEAVRLRAKDLAQQLAPARDLDVFLSELFEPVANANGSQEALAVLRRRAEEARKRAFGDAFAAVSGPRLRMFMRDVSDITDGRGWPFPPHQGSSVLTGVRAYEVPAETVAERVLSHRYKRARKRARHLDRLSSVERHSLRIELKKLRYAAEFYMPFFDADQAKKFLARLARMQDVLGAVNDVTVAKHILEKLVNSAETVNGVSANDVSFAAGLIYGWHLERAAHTWREAVERWKKFARTRTFWTAAAAR
ncbi:MAG TPA: CHAD domain-containing protein [Rhizomicrobium sp.]|jgi:CHAD domain-containing protein|nr:CHAD domain-containing protein [Rhizomicrobium sp.]